MPISCTPYEDLSNISNKINRGIVLARLGRMDESLHISQSVLRILNVASSPSYQGFKAAAYAVVGMAYELKSDWQLALKAFLDSDKINESAEAVIGAARCMRALNLPLFDLTLKRGIALLADESVEPYSDCTPELLFVVKVAPHTVSMVEAWVSSMSKLVPMDYWATPARSQLLGLLEKS